MNSKDKDKNLQNDAERTAPASKRCPKHERCCCGIVGPSAFASAIHEDGVCERCFPTHESAPASVGEGTEWVVEVPEIDAVSLGAIYGLSAKDVDHLEGVLRAYRASSDERLTDEEIAREIATAICEKYPMWPDWIAIASARHVAVSAVERSILSILQKRRSVPASEELRGKRWYSICSKHPTFDPQCSRCDRGEWLPEQPRPSLDVKQAADGLAWSVIKKWPTSIHVAHYHMRDLLADELSKLMKGER